MLLLYLAMIDADEDKSKFETLYFLYRDQMFLIANTVLHDSYESEDAVHNAFLSVAMHMERVGAVNSTSVKSFLFTVTKNQALNLLAQKRHNGNLVYLDDQEDITNTASPDKVLDDYCTKENLRSVIDAIHQLEEPYRSVLFLRFVNGFNLKEIAKLLDRKYDAVKKQFARGKRYLIVILRKQKD